MTDYTGVTSYAKLKTLKTKYITKWVFFMYKICDPYGSTMVHALYYNSLGTFTHDVNSKDSLTFDFSADLTTSKTISISYSSTTVMFMREM